MGRSVFDGIAVGRTRAEATPEFHEGLDAMSSEFRLLTIMDVVVIDVDDSIKVRVSILLQNNNNRIPSGQFSLHFFLYTTYESLWTYLIVHNWRLCK